LPGQLWTFHTILELIHSKSSDTETPDFFLSESGMVKMLNTDAKKIKFTKLEIRSAELEELVMPSSDRGGL
jgi:hypothetical protein